MKTFKKGDIVELDPDFVQNCRHIFSLNAFGLYFGQHYTVKEAFDIVYFKEIRYGWNPDRFKKVIISNNEISIF